MFRELIERLTGRTQGERDVPADAGVAGSRDTGGVENPVHPDQQSTTGTTPDESFVGRVAGDDVGYAGETGAEARSEAARKSQASSESGE
jgi:hypothetical protein